MWILKDESNHSYYPSSAQPFIIGRNEGDLTCKFDGSISRSHAKIDISSCSEKCQLTDTKSKYGTFLLDNNNQVVKQIEGVYMIQPNDRIRFGLQNCILTFIHPKFITMSSVLTPEDKAQLEEIMGAINGRILEAWDDSCTHLTVSKAKITAKLACALAAGIPIVTIDYWKSVRKAKVNGNPVPDPSSFCPVLEDLMLLKNQTSLLPNPSRKTIFTNFLFIHLRKNQMDTYKKMIELAGGSSIFYGDKSFDKKLLTDSNSRVILSKEDDSQIEPDQMVGVSRVISFLKKNNLRIIPVIEIPLAIFHASVQSYCNPYFSYENLLKNPRERKVVEEGEVLAPETQASSNCPAGRMRIIPESLVIAETESFEDRTPTTGSIEPSITEFPKKMNKRKVSRDLENDPGEIVKKAKAVRIPEEAVKGDSNEKRNEDKKNDKIDAEIIKSPVKIETISKRDENNDVPENSWHESDDEMETDQRPAVEDNGEVTEKSYRQRNLQDSLGDESMDKSLWRPEIFSAKPFGKTFKKFDRRVLQRPVIEWEPIA